MKKIILNLICIIMLLTLVSGCVNTEKVLKKELDKRYNNYEIIDSIRYWNTGGEDYVDGIVKINDDLYEIIVDMSGKTNEYYESKSKEIDLNININNKNYSSNNNLILMELSFNNAYTTNKPILLLFIKNEKTLDFYDDLYQLIEKLYYQYKNEEYKSPIISIFFTDHIDYGKREDYKKLLLLKMLAWDNTKSSKKLYKNLNVNNYMRLGGYYSGTEYDILNRMKQEIENLENSYETGMLYDDYVYQRGNNED